MQREHLKNEPNKFRDGLVSGVSCEELLALHGVREAEVARKMRKGTMLIAETCLCMQILFVLLCLFKQNLFCCAKGKLTRSKIQVGDILLYTQREPCQAVMVHACLQVNAQLALIGQPLRLVTLLPNCNMFSS